MREEEREEERIEGFGERAEEFGEDRGARENKRVRESER